MATVFANVVFTIFKDGTSVATSEFVVPGGKTLRLYGVAARIQNTAASIGAAQAIIQLQATGAAVVSAGPVVAECYAIAIATATSIGGANAIALGGMDIAAGQTVKLIPRATGLTGAILQCNAWGILYP
jgi:hypothetical protein